MLDIFAVNLLELVKYFIIFSYIVYGEIYKGKRFWISMILLLCGFCGRTFILETSDSTTSIIFLITMIMLVYRGKIKNKILVFLVSLLAINYLDTIIYALLGCLFKRKIWWYFIVESNKAKIADGLIAILVLLVVMLIHSRKTKKKWLVGEIATIQILLLSGAMIGFYIVMVILMLFIRYGHQIIANRMYILLGISSTITITCIIAFFIYSNYLKQQNDMHLENVHLYDENLGLRLSYYDQVQGNYEKVRQFRHDFRHHLAAIEGLIQGKEYSELEDYVVQLSKQDVKLKNERMRYTGNYMIDAIIVGIVANDNFKDVDFQFDGMLPTKIRIRDMDICGVLANGLENALEACMKNNDRKIVALKAGCFENIISFQIKNTYDSKLYDELSKGRFDSTKTDDGHGYGIRNMQRIVKEYNRKLEYSVDQEWVTADIYMQQKDENQPSETTNNQ